MLSARNVTLAVIVIACLSVLGSLVSLAMPEDNGGMATDSYGTRASGQKAMYDVLRELQLPVERSIGPPTANWREPTTLVLWGPQPNLVSIEPAHLHRVRDWVKSGGRVMLAPASDDLWFSRRGSTKQSPKEQSAMSIWEALGLPKLDTQEVDVEASQWSEDAKPKPVEPESTFNSLVANVPAKSSPVTIKADGDLTALAKDIAELAAPEGSLKTLVFDDDVPTRPTGKIEFSLTGQDDEPESHVVVANFPFGKGQVTVVADQRLLENRWLARGDNAPLGVRLLAAGNRQIVWDEFYHGLTLRGNPLALLKNNVYAAIAGMGLVGLGIWTWRKAVGFGPPSSVRPPSRRALGEYVDAMALLFARARGGKPFVLAEVREGVLWALRRRLHLSPGKEQLPLVAAAMARKDPGAARKLESAIAALDRAITSRAAHVDASTINTLQQVTACLSKHSTNEFATKLPR